MGPHNALSPTVQRNTYEASHRSGRTQACQRTQRRSMQRVRQVPASALQRPSPPKPERRPLYMTRTLGALQRKNTHEFYRACPCREQCSRLTALTGRSGNPVDRLTAGAQKEEIRATGSRQQHNSQRDKCGATSSPLISATRRHRTLLKPL